MSVPSTVLSIAFVSGGSAPGVPPFSARQAHQTLDPIDAVKGARVLRRTVNGTLKDLTPPQMRKYRSEISCQDQAPPAIDGIWPGMVVQVGCNYELSYLTAGGTPQRPAVPGSQRIEGDFTIYRPLLTMMIVDFSGDKDEWGAMTSWKLVLEEV
jgi:hypothetical protein